MTAALGKQVLVNVFTEGTVKSNGDCETSSFIRKGKLYEGYYEQHTLSGGAWEVEGVVHQPGGRVKIDGGRARADYAQGYTASTEFGDYIWNVEDQACQERFSQIHVGTAQVHQRREAAVHDYIESLAIFNDKKELREERRSIAVSFQGRIRVCGRSCYTTQIPGLATCMYRPGEKICLLYTSPSPRDA